MTVAIKNLNNLTAAKKVAILGDMFELGEESALQHHQIITLATGIDASILVFVGHHFYAAKGSSSAYFFQTIEEASNFIETQNWDNALILLKGSRGMALEKLLPLL